MAVNVRTEETRMLDTPRHPHHSHPPLAGLPSPAPDMVTVPARQGLEAVDILRLGAGVGPVLHDGRGDSLSFLVPPGTAAGWDVPGSACTETDGRGFTVAPGEPPAAGGAWLLPPSTSNAEVTDPAVLREALDEAARMIELADRV
jgi:hypothetical protein